MKLYDIAADYRRLQDMLDSAETPEEMRQTLQDTLESVSGDFADKAENIAALIAEDRALLSGCEDEITRLRDKCSRIENQIDSMKRYLMNEMQYTGQRKIQAGTWQISIAKNGGKAPIKYAEDLIVDSLPDKFIRISKSIDTQAVRDALESGEQLDFAEIGERGESLRIK